MDGRGRALDNVFVERLWRTVKYEDIYLHDYDTGLTLAAGLQRYFAFYNHERPHSSLDYLTPVKVHRRPETLNDWYFVKADLMGGGDVVSCFQKRRQRWPRSTLSP